MPTTQRVGYTWPAAQSPLPWGTLDPLAVASGGPKTSGAERTPAMTGEAVRTTGPASSTEPKRDRSSSRRIRPSSRASTAPDAEMGAEPEGHVGIGVPGRIEHVGGGAEHRFVPVGRRVQHQHRLTGAELTSAQLGRAGSSCA